MTSVYGVSAFGLNDCVADLDGVLKTSGFYVADAVLPKRALGQIRTGDEAEQERVHSGLYWPPEARVKPGEPLRRVPIPVAWSLLVDAGDTTVPVRWNVGGGVSIPLASIMAAHLKDLLHGSGFDAKNDNRAVVAIPDHLDEYHQETLLRAFGGVRHRISMVWRTVAAAMEWLDKAMPEDLETGDWMLVVYIGPDGMDFMTFELREEVFGGNRFILPVRNRPRHSPGPAGWQWACALSAKADPICSIDHGAFWQTFTNFPELWAAIAGRPWKKHELPRAWSTADGWRYWHPPKKLFAESVCCVTDGGDLLLDLVKTSSSILPRKREIKEETWGQHLTASLSRALLQRNGRLRGAVICGPLCPVTTQAWIQEALINLPCRPDACPDTIWLASAEEDPVATGARLFGRRLAAGLPTYLDTLPRLALYAEKVGGGLEWMDIVEAKECAGGKTYTRSIPNRFFLKKHTDALHVYMRKDAQETGTESPYRYGEVKFPSIPARDVKLTIEVEMRPASGLARVVIVPEKEETFQGRARVFDYSNMIKVEEKDLPEPELRWPETLHYEVATSKDAFTDTRFKGFIALSEDVSRSYFIEKLDEMKRVLCSSFFDQETNIFETRKRIDENGISGSEYGDTLVTAIASKIESRANEFLHSRNPPSEAIKYVVRATWLWGKTPEAISDYLMHYFLTYEGNNYGNTWRYFAEAASRCFNSKQHFAALFDAIYRRSISGVNNPFTLQSSKALARVLAYREDAYDALESDMAVHFAKRAAEAIRKQVNNRTIAQIFFQGALLFLALLRFRIKEPEFMDPENPRDVSLFKEVENCLKKARAIVRDQPNILAQIDGLIQGIVDFMYSKGKSGLIGAIASEAGGDE